MASEAQRPKRRVPVDRSPEKKVRRGQVEVEARLDLHGMTTSHARQALLGFLHRCRSNGMRTVLVITGKGKTKEDDGPIPVRRGVLKHNVPQWLSMPPLNAVVLQVTQAHVSHGGTGAYYVYLRHCNENQRTNLLSVYSIYENKSHV